MSIFKDSKEVEWELRFSVPNMIRVARRMNVTIQSIINWQALPIADMLEAVPLLIEDQLKEQKRDPLKFLDELEPQDLPNLMTALSEAITDAFPQIKLEKKEGEDGEAEKAPLVNGG